MKYQILVSLLLALNFLSNSCRPNYNIKSINTTSKNIDNYCLVHLNDKDKDSLISIIENVRKKKGDVFLIFSGDVFCGYRIDVVPVLNFPTKFQNNIKHFYIKHNIKYNMIFSYENALKGVWEYYKEDNEYIFSNPITIYDSAKSIYFNVFHEIIAPPR